MTSPPHPIGHVTASRFADVLARPQLAKLHQSVKLDDGWCVQRIDDGAIMQDGFKRKADAESVRMQLDEDARSDRWSSLAFSYRNELLGELLTGWRSSDTSGSWSATEWGNEIEPMAIRAICQRYGAIGCVETFDDGSVLTRYDKPIVVNEYREHPDHRLIGGAPDLLIGPDIYCEVKCPYEPANTIAYRRITHVPPEHYHQVMGYGWITGRTRYVFAVYDPRLEVSGLDPLYTLEAEYDSAWERKHADRIIKFRDELYAEYSEMIEIET